MVTTKIIVIVQAILIFGILLFVFASYPRISVNVLGSVVNFNSSNTKIIVISQSPDFSDAKYVEIKENLSLRLAPGVYYWKARNNLLEGFENRFSVDSEVGLNIERENNDTELVNMGNVRVNITRDKGGILAGHIVLDPNETQTIEDEGKYVGRQNG